MPHWHVLGAGALGSLWAAGLSRAGHQVELLLKNPDRLALFQRQHAITLIHREKPETIPVTASITRTGTSAINHLLITTKAHQTIDALTDAAPRLTPDCQVLLVQNGMGVAEQISENFPGLELFCGVTTDGAYCPQPFTVVHAAVGETFIGGYRHTTSVNHLIDQLPVQFLDIKSCSDIIDRQWQKLAINCAINGLTALYQCRNGDLLIIAEARERLQKLCEEIARLGEVIGYKEWKQELVTNTVSVLRLTAENYSSMYQDIHNGRSTEIDFLNGFLISKAKQSGMACPENERLYREIKEKESECPRQ